jgi:hypothetical protein
MSDKTQFWQEIRNTLMIRGDGWKAVVDGLPDRIDASQAKQKLQSSNQLANCNMQGQAFIAGEIIYAKPSAENLAAHLPPESLTRENLILQWLYQFLILESVAKHLKEKPLAEWHPMFLDMYGTGFHFMVYMAALLCMIEEMEVSTVGVLTADFIETENDVKQRIREATLNLWAKAQDYGESFRRHGVTGLLPRLWDKVARYATMSCLDREAHFEPKSDSARDLLGYSIIAWSLLLEVPAAQNIQKKEIEIVR